MWKNTAEFVSEKWPLIRPLVAEGKPPGVIAKHLNERGEKTQKGSEWSSASVGDLILKGQLRDAQAKLQETKAEPSESAVRALERLGYEVNAIEEMDGGAVSETWYVVDLRTGKGGLITSAEALERMAKSFRR